MTTIYHNPKCSKSRQTLALLQEKGITPEVVEYLKTPPSAQRLGALCQALGKSPKEIIRTKEQTFKDLNCALDDKTDAQWLDTLAQNPVLIERPIVFKDGKAALGRPPEQVLDIL